MKWFLVCLFSFQVCFADVPDIHLRPPSQVAASAINQNIQIVFFMMFFSTVQSVMRHLDISGYTIKTASREHLEKIIHDSVESIINDPSLWIGFSASLGSALTLAEPARAALEWAFKNKAGKSLMRQFLLSAVPVAITAYTWEFFRQLWTEGRTLCSTPDCYLRTDNLAPLIDSLRLSSRKNNPEALKNFEALKEQLKNMGIVLFKSSELRTRMMNNIFQTHGTVNDLTVAAAALLVGSYITLRFGSIFKGYTGLVSNVAGIVLGVVSASILPIDFEKKVFQFRRKSATQSLSTCVKNAKSILLNIDPLHDQSDKLLDTFDDCKARRQIISTVQLRIMYGQNQQLKAYAKEFQMHPEQTDRILPLAIQLQTEMSSTLAKTLEAYQKQQIIFSHFLKNRLPEPLRVVLQCEIDQLKSTQTLFLDRMLPLFNTFPALSVDEDPESEWHRAQYYLSGISEDHLLNLSGFKTMHQCVRSPSTQIGAL